MDIFPPETTAAAGYAGSTGIKAIPVPCTAKS